MSITRQLIILASLLVCAPLAAQESNALPPHQYITSGPAHHWFGYHDKLQFDPTGRYVLGMEVPFEHRSPTADDVIKIGMVDLKDGNRWAYPKGPNRLQTPHLYHIKSGRRIDLGHFRLPKTYSGEWRVDTHPRLSRDGRFVCIDAVKEGEGRQMCLIDINGMTVTERK